MTHAPAKDRPHAIIHGEYAPAFFGLLAGRVVELIVETGAVSAQAFGIAAPIRTFSTMTLLAREAMSVTEIAHHLGVTHAAVIKHTRSLEGLGLISREQDSRDARRRPFSLTQDGRVEAERIDAFMQTAARVYQDMFREIGMDVFEGLRQMEAQLSAKDFATRMREAGPG